MRFGDAIYGADTDCHGRMDLRFQHEPGAEPSQIVRHVRMLYSSNTGQQAALGILGVNLIHSAFRHAGDCRRPVDLLVENLTWDRRRSATRPDGPSVRGP